MQAHDIEADVKSVGRIEAVPTILDVVCRTTGMRFAAVARVTEDRWIACCVRDEIDFGLKPGGELKVETTICHEIRQSQEPVVIDHVTEDKEWCGHPTPAMYGFESYISVPVILADGWVIFWNAVRHRSEARSFEYTRNSGHVPVVCRTHRQESRDNRKLAATESALVEERGISELREEFIAVLGHDLRTPMRAIGCFVDLLVKKLPLTEETLTIARHIRASSARMIALIDNLLGFARGRLDQGLILSRDASEPLEPVSPN